MADATQPADDRRLRLLILDVDGVLTDGSIWVSDQGFECKRFHVRDGFAIRAAMRVGLDIAILTGRSTRAVALRMTELGVKHVIQGSSDKKVGFETVCQLAGVEAEETAYLGDDVVDLPAMLRCGYPMAVADATAEVKAVARFVTQARGGHGAVREAVEHLLKRQSLWAQVIDRYNI